MNNISLTFHRDKRGRLEVQRPKTRTELRDFRERQMTGEMVEGELARAHRMYDEYRSLDNGTHDLNPAPGLVVRSQTARESSEQTLIKFDGNGSSEAMEVVTRSVQRGVPRLSTQSFSFADGLTYCVTEGEEGKDGRRTLLRETSDGLVSYHTELVPIAVTPPQREEVSAPIALIRDEAGNFQPLREAPSTLAEIPGWLQAKGGAREADFLLKDFDAAISGHEIPTFDNVKGRDACPERGRILFADSVYDGGTFDGDVEAEVVLGRSGERPSFVNYSKYDDGLDEGVENCHILFQNGPQMSLVYTERTEDREFCRELKEQEPGVFLYSRSER